MDDMDDMDNMDNMDDMKKVEKSLFQRDSAMAGWLTKFAPQPLIMLFWIKNFFDCFNQPFHAIIQRNMRAHHHAMIVNPMRHELNSGKVKKWNVMIKIWLLERDKRMARAVLH